MSIAPTRQLMRVINTSLAPDPETGRWSIRLDLATSSGINRVLHYRHLEAVAATFLLNSLINVLGVSCWEEVWGTRVFVDLDESRRVIALTNTLDESNTMTLLPDESRIAA